MDELTGKRVVVLGLARQGQAMARFAAEAGAQVVVSDLRPAELLHDSVEALADLEIDFVLGEHPMSLLEGVDVMAVSGGVPTDAPIVSAARLKGIRVTNDSLEFMKRVPAPVIGITGSAGKTTTTALTGAMARAAGRRTWVGGNIGHPLLDDLHQMQDDDVVVQELSSFQLELWSAEWGNSAVRSPAIAAVLNITPNHLDRHGTMAAYAAAKANILRYQGPEDVAVLCADDPGAMRLQPIVRSRLCTFSMKEEVGDGAFVRAGQVWLRDDSGDTVVCETGEVRLRGEHNVLNVLAAVTLANSAGLDIDAMRTAIASFSGVPHRLELVATVNGVQYVNDSIATAPERALAAIKAFSEPLVLLAGGRDKKMDWDPWAQQVTTRVKHVVLFGDLADLLEEKLRQQMQTGLGISCAASLSDAVQVAARIATRGDVVLLSPGGTSYDAFRDFEERGEHFRELVSALERF